MQSEDVFRHWSLGACLSSLVNGVCLTKFTGTLLHYAEQQQLDMDFDDCLLLLQKYNKAPVGFPMFNGVCFFLRRPPLTVFLTSPTRLPIFIRRTLLFAYECRKRSDSFYIRYFLAEDLQADVPLYAANHDDVDSKYTSFLYVNHTN